MYLRSKEDRKKLLSVPLPEDSDDSNLEADDSDDDPDFIPKLVKNRARDVGNSSGGST